MALMPQNEMTMPGMTAVALAFIVLLALYGLYKMLESFDIDFILSFVLLLLFLLVCYFVTKFVYRQYRARRNNIVVFPFSLRKGAAIIGAILYLVSPVDLIPDVLPLIGFADDAALLLALAYYVFITP